jgi:hypothetical protein
MPYSLKEHIAECYRRAEEYGQLRKKTSNPEKREILWTTRQQFFLLAKVLERKLSKLQSVRLRRDKKLTSA